MNVFYYNDYRLLIKAWMESSPKKGRGQIQKMAEKIGVSPSQFSQIMSRARNLSEAQAYDLSRYFRLTDLETEYFLALVQIAKTERSDIKELLKRNLKRISETQPEVSILDRSMRTLGDIDQLKFYSDRFHVVVWLLTSIPGFDTEEKISSHLKLDRLRVRDILNFLVHTGLSEKKNERYSIGTTRTLVTKGSPMLSRHHMNWRLQAIDILQAAPLESIFYTSPMSLSEKDARAIKEILLRNIASIESFIGPSKSEKTYCLNIDWFEF